MILDLPIDAGAFTSKHGGTSSSQHLPITLPSSETVPLAVSLRKIDGQGLNEEGGGGKRKEPVWPAENVQDIWSEDASI